MPPREIETAAWFNVLNYTERNFQLREFRDELMRDTFRKQTKKVIINSGENQS